MAAGMLVNDVTTVAARVLTQLPQPVHDALELVTIRVLAWPPTGERSDAQAVFMGRQQAGDPDDDEDEDHVPAAGQILLFAANLTSAEEVERAVLHEIGHALGADELDVAELGL